MGNMNTVALALVHFDICFADDFPKASVVVPDYFVVFRWSACHDSHAAISHTLSHFRIFQDRNNFAI